MEREIMVKVLYLRMLQRINVTVYNPHLSRSEPMEGLGIQIFKSYQQYHYYSGEKEMVKTENVF